MPECPFGNDTHSEMHRMVKEMHTLIFGKPEEIEALGLRGIVAKHERALSGVNRAIAYIAGLIVVIVGALVEGWIHTGR